MSSTTQIRPAGFKPADAAYQLSISPQGIYNLINKGEIKAVKIGHRIVIPASEIDRLLTIEDSE